MVEEFTSREMREAAEEEDLIEKFSKWSEGIGSGWKLSIYREEPKEFAGFLEETVIDQTDNPCDLNSIVQRWGGKCLRLMLRGPDGEFKKRLLVPLRTYPPLMYGRPISSSNNPFENWDNKPHTAEEREDKILAAAKLLRELSPPQQQPNMFEGVQLFMPLLQTLLEAQMARSSQPTPQTSINETLQAMVAMREFMGEHNSAIGDGDGLQSMLPSILRLGESILSRKTEESKTTTSVVPKITPPQTVTIPPVKPVSTQNKVAEKQEIVQSIISDLPSHLSTMPGEKGAQFFLDILRRMPEAEQEACLRVIFHHFGVEDEEDIATEDPRGTQTSDAGDPQADRS